MKNIELETVAFDWLTVTSFDYQFYKFWSEELKSWKEEKREAKMMQYLGFEKELSAGRMRLMVGSQKDREHYVLHLTSGLAELYTWAVVTQHKQGMCRVTRADLQVTITLPKKWNQVKFFTSMHERGIASFVESKDRKTGLRTETVGVGSRQSDRYKRMYTKVAGKGLLLRFEVEFKGDRANAVMRAVSKDETKKREILLHELLMLKSPAAEAAFYNAIDAPSAYRVTVKNLTSAGKTNTWLLDSCLPVLVRQLTDHDEDGSLWDAYIGQLSRVAREHGYQLGDC